MKDMQTFGTIVLYTSIYKHLNVQSITEKTNKTDGNRECDRERVPGEVITRENGN